MKKNLLKFLSLTTILGTALSLTACGGATSSSQSQEESSITSQAGGNVDFVVPENYDPNVKTTIIFYHTMGQNLQEILDVYLEDFYELYPNIKVEHTAIGSYDDVRDQMTTQISAGSSECDLAYCYPDHVAMYNKAKSLISLDNLIDDPTYGFTAEQKNDFVKAYYDEGKCFGDNKMYCLPFSKSSEVMYYDKTFFKNNNLSVPTTWDELEEVCAQIKAIDKNSIPLGYDSSSNWFITLCEQYGSPYTSAEGEHFLFDNATNKGFMKRIKDWYSKGYVTTKTLYGSYTSGLFTSDNGQRCYLCIGSSAGATYQVPAPKGDSFPFETGIASIPQVDAENHGAVISQGPDVCIFNSGNPQKVMASWLLTKFLTTNVQFQAQFSMVSGYTPVIKSVFDYSVYADFLKTADNTRNIAALSTSVTVAQENLYFTSPAFEGSSKAREVVGDLLDKILVYNGDNVDAYIDQAFKEAVANCKA